MEPGGLARCVASPAEFLAEAFTRRPDLSRRRDVSGLLGLDDIDRVLTGSGVRRPAVRLVRDGDLIDPKAWTTRARTGATWMDDLIHPGKVMDHFAAGCTIVLQSLHRWWPAVTDLCRDLELDLGHAVQANAYLSPAGVAGFDPHHDTHDVFVLQLHGTKDWTVREPVVEAPLARHRSDHDEAARQPVLLETRLEPGDCLYLPRGYIHSARTETGASLHLTIGLLATTAHDLLRRLVDAAAEDPRFRRTLPVGFGTDRVVAEGATKEVVADWMAWLAEMDPEPIAAATVERFARGRRPILSGQLLELLALDQIADDSRVRLRPRTVVDVAVDGEQAVVTCGDRRIALPAVVFPVLERLLDGAAHRVCDLGDLIDHGSRMVLVRRLVREGVLVTVER
jgi:lysine-specific demethylase/histidyl-hydroxylase NO66